MNVQLANQEFIMEKNFAPLKAVLEMYKNSPILIYVKFVNMSFNSFIINKNLFWFPSFDLEWSLNYTLFKFEEKGSGLFGYGYIFCPESEENRMSNEYVGKVNFKVFHRLIGDYSIIDVSYKQTTDLQEKIYFSKVIELIKEFCKIKMIELNLVELN